MFTKTVVDPETRESVVLVQCDLCGGEGFYWRPDISHKWPCNKCEGHGCYSISHGAKFSPHVDRNYRDYRPIKGRV